MDNDDIQKKCEQFLSSLGVPGFIVFGWQKADAELGMVYSFRDVPVPAAIKGLSWALYDFSSKTL